MAVKLFTFLFLLLLVTGATTSSNCTSCATTNGEQWTTLPPCDIKVFNRNFLIILTKYGITWWDPSVYDTLDDMNKAISEGIKKIEKDEEGKHHSEYRGMKLFYTTQNSGFDNLMVTGTNNETNEFHIGVVNTDLFLNKSDHFYPFSSMDIGPYMWSYDGYNGKAVRKLEMPRNSDGTPMKVFKKDRNRYICNAEHAQFSPDKKRLFFEYDAPIRIFAHLNERAWALSEDQESNRDCGTYESAETVYTFSGQPDRPFQTYWMGPWAEGAKYLMNQFQHDHYTLVAEGRNGSFEHFLSIDGRYGDTRTNDTMRKCSIRTIKSGQFELPRMLLIHDNYFYHNYHYNGSPHYQNNDNHPLDNNPSDHHHDYYDLTYNNFFYHNCDPYDHYHNDDHHDPSDHRNYYDYELEYYHVYTHDYHYSINDKCFNDPTNHDFFYHNSHSYDHPERKHSFADNPNDYHGSPHHHNPSDHRNYYDYELAHHYHHHDYYDPTYNNFFYHNYDFYDYPYP
ncbi:hypothetical protein QR680_011866 [Steinernema hermaphroditum]|uniref:Dipeptidylpeptidase IV N-terminal domain-containing protein n=1 Tax=Steinernema hermaphroditum TaxID=289476 RepID=A0AA39I005_9BILA|nr:hypothetical protein QR680_011866 [Steinernema hermaphroditum]